MGEVLSIQGRDGAERQQGVDADAGKRAVADAHLDAGAGPASAAPPVGDAHEDATGFESGDFLEELMGLLRRPCLRLKEPAAFEHPGGPCALLRGALNGFQQGAEGGLIPCAGVFLERPRQRQVHRFVLRRKPVREGRHEGKRLVGSALVLREMKSDAAQLMQRRVDGSQPCLETARSLRARHGRLLHFPPQPCKHLRGGILGSAHRRNPQRQLGKKPPGRQDLGACKVRLAFRNPRDPMEEGAGKLAPELCLGRPREPRRAFCCEGKQTSAGRCRKRRHERGKKARRLRRFLQHQPPSRAQHHLMSHRAPLAAFTPESSSVAAADWGLAGRIAAAFTIPGPARRRRRGRVRGGWRRTDHFVGAVCFRQ